MRILLNFDKSEKEYLSTFAYFMQTLGYDAASTSKNLTIGELMHMAKQVKADFIVCNNEQTLRYLVPGNAPTVDQWRGSRLNFEIPCLIVNKFAHIHTVPHGRWLLEQDLSKLRYWAHTPARFAYKKLLDVSQFNDALTQLSECVFIAHDIETRTNKTKKLGEDEAAPEEVGATYITCAAWTGVTVDGKFHTYVLPLVDYDGDHWRTDQEYIAAIKFMRRVNALPVPKVMHNGMYDSTHLIVYNCEPLNYTLDTMYMAHAAYSELPKSLDFVASTLLWDYIYWKHDSDEASKKRDQEMYWAYNAKDTWYTARILIEQLRRYPSYAAKNYKVQFPLTYPSLYCNFEGAKLDQEKRLQLRSSALTKLEEAERRLQECFADPGFNPGSWQQVSKYLYDVFGAQKPNIGKSKSKTDEKNLKAVAEQHPLLARLVDEILIYRENSKAIGTYFDFVQKNGRLMWALNPFGTDTSRMACSSSSFWCGTQVQNIPSYAKEMIIADEGFEIFEADNKQSEGRTTAYCSQEENLIAALEDAEKDFYKTLGTLFFDIPYEEVTDFFRNKVLKRIVHGTNYMMGAKTFIENIGARVLYETATKLGLEIVDVVTANKPNQRTLKGFAKELLDSYHKPFPRVRIWYDEIKREIRTTGHLVSPLGYTRRFFGNIEKDHNMLRGAVAHQPQQLSVQILNKGFQRAYRDLVLKYPEDFRLKAQIHDSIFGQWRISKREFFAQKLAECMYNPTVVHGRTLVIPIDIKYGQNWAEREVAKDGTIINPNGTVKYKGLKQ